VTIQIKDRHIVLVGMMGAGKTTVGELLARELGRPLLDTDRLVEEKESRSIAEIFSHAGEAYFRQAESDAIREAVSHPPAVIATGGGALLREENRVRLAGDGVLIWLQADLETLMRRTAQMEGVRPLRDAPHGNTVDQQRRLAGMMAERTPYYAQADIVVDTTDRSCQAVTQTILERLRGGVGQLEER
jgi:shikimate kinase